jgi:hypothetical protein
MNSHTKGNTFVCTVKAKEFGVRIFDVNIGVKDCLIDFYEDAYESYESIA